MRCCAVSRNWFLASMKEWGRWWSPWSKLKLHSFPDRNVKETTSLLRMISSLPLQANYAINCLFRLDLILHVCKIPVRCDRFGISNFATKQGLILLQMGLSISRHAFSYVVYRQQRKQTEQPLGLVAVEFVHLNLSLWLSMDARIFLLSILFFWFCRWCVCQQRGTYTVISPISRYICPNLRCP